MSEIRARNAIEALQIAEQLRSEAKYDWFRGQRQDWPLKSSFARLEEPERKETLAKVARFEHWVKSTRGLEDLGANTDMIVAVAQHYGFPTHFVDFTTEPKIAAFFATDEWQQSGATKGIIMCLKTTELIEFWETMPKKYGRPECLPLAVRNLWRLEAQHGTFLYCPYGNFEHIYDIDRIVFTHSGEVPTLPRELIYPSRKSDLEILLDQFFLNERLIIGTRVAMSMASNFAAVHTFEAPAEYGDPELVGECPPPPLDSWSDDARRSWLVPDAERFHDAYTDLSVEFADDSTATPASVYETAVAKIMQLLSGTQEGRAKSVRFFLNANSRVSLDFLERLWDGLRRLPFTNEEIASAIGNAMVLFLVRRGRPGYPDWRAEAEVCFGEVIEVEFGADDGSYSRSLVSKKQLLGAVRPDIANYLNPDWHAQLLGNMTGLLQAVFVPNRLFDFRKLATLFATQLAPVQVLADREAVYYSPARIVKLGLP